MDRVQSTRSFEWIITRLDNLVKTEVYWDLEEVEKSQDRESIRHGHFNIQVCAKSLIDVFLGS